MNILDLSNLSEQYSTIKIGLVSISDRASTGVYQDEGLPSLKAWLNLAVLNPIEFIEHLIADDQTTIESILKKLADEDKCDLVLTTGGTGPSVRDVTPEATLAVSDKFMPGFGEQMRQISLYYVATAILSRQIGVIRKNTLILNLPGRPKAIAETLEGVKINGEIKVQGIFASIPYCVDLIGGGFICTDENVIKAFRPKGTSIN